MCNIPRPPGRRQERQYEPENRLPNIYGDHIKQKTKRTVRVLFQNPQGLGPLYPPPHNQSTKINKLKNILLRHNVDILGLAEVNKDWRKIPRQNSIWHMTESWFEHRKIITSNNTAVLPTSPVQFGGTLLMATNKIAYSIIQTEIDSSKLGRWSSILLRGENNFICRIICAYCPCISAGPSSTYALQTVGLMRNNIHVCPRTQFWEDLKLYIDHCQAKQENIILMGDWNSNHMDTTEWMSNFGLVDIIHSRHHQDDPPITCSCSSNGPIDGIFVSQSLRCSRGGYLSFDYMEVDHRGLWCDIPIELLLGHNMPNPVYPNARRLKTNDPRTQKKYIKELHKRLMEHNVYHRFDQLEKDMIQTIFPTDILKFEELDEIITKSMEHAERHCRKLKMGMIKWSPMWQRAC